MAVWLPACMQHSQQQPKQDRIARQPTDKDRQSVATDLYLSPTGSDSNAGTAAAPFKTIRAASEVAQPGTTVHVAPGTYEGGFKTSASGTAAAHIRYVSEVQYGARIVAAPGSPSNGVGYWWNAGDYVDIEGFEVDGSRTSDPGWRIGIYGSGSHTTVSGTKVHDILTDPRAYANAASTGNGGCGIGMDNFSGAIDASVTANLVYNIGPNNGVYVAPGAHGVYQITSGDVTNNVVYTIDGVGVATWHGAKGINIVNNTIDHALDGGIFVGSGDSGADATTGDYVTVTNNIVTNSPKGIYEGGKTGVHNRYVANLLFGNATNISLQSGATTAETITADPKFVSRDARNYHLQAGSPAIDAGTSTGAPSTDFDGHARPQRSSVDIGAYEFAASTPTPTTSPAARVPPSSSEQSTIVQVGPPALPGQGSKGNGAR